MNIYKGLLFLHGHLIHDEDDRDAAGCINDGDTHAPVSQPFAQAAKPFANGPCPAR